MWGPPSPRHVAVVIIVVLMVVVRVITHRDRPRSSAFVVVAMVVEVVVVAVMAIAVIWAVVVVGAAMAVVAVGQSARRVRCDRRDYNRL